eukprot:TRINITY_DN8889_c0_g1_i5.p1 TRINITY_DN8889_c0_g1~~TRINITY_DN8889_c0_g1_i5.p1  ORF type:complete len:303 (+),score=27.78 TRINITY_DN8889_c0_g1_i5:147-1055(+)
MSFNTASALLTFRERFALEVFVPRPVDPLLVNRFNILKLPTPTFSPYTPASPAFSIDEQKETKRVINTTRSPLSNFISQRSTFTSLTTSTEPQSNSEIPGHHGSANMRRASENGKLSIKSNIRPQPIRFKIATSLESTTSHLLRQSPSGNSLNSQSDDSFSSRMDSSRSLKEHGLRARNLGASQILTPVKGPRQSDHTTPSASQHRRSLSNFQAGSESQASLPRRSQFFVKKTEESQNEQPKAFRRKSNSMSGVLANKKCLNQPNNFIIRKTNLFFQKHQPTLAPFGLIRVPSSLQLSLIHI